MTVVQGGVDVNMTMLSTNGSAMADNAAHLANDCMQLLELLQYRMYREVIINYLLFSFLCQELKESQCVSVCPFGVMLSRALNSP